MKMMTDGRIVERKTYVTSDGKEFDEYSDAQKHQSTVSYRDDVLAWIEYHIVPAYKGTTKLLEDVYPESKDGNFWLSRGDVADILILYMTDLDDQIKAAVADAVTKELNNVKV